MFSKSFHNITTKKFINLPLKNAIIPTITSSSIVNHRNRRFFASQVNNANKEKLIIFDTTLRDGEQSPGVTFTTEEKIDIAKHLSSLGVDVIEAGFPVASPGDFEAVARIAKEVGPLMQGRENIGKPVTITGLARAKEKDIKRCYDAVSQSPLHRIHTFLATSDIHLKYKLKIDREECIKRASEAVKYAKSLCEEVEFSAEDGGRSDKEFLCKLLSKVIESGATILNIPDTVGYTSPEEYGALIRYLIENTPGSDKAIWSTHCHDDLGLATANTLSGVLNGARQVEVSINGIGERAGNTSLEEVAMNIRTHPDFYPVYHSINTQQIYRISTLVSSHSGMLVQPNKAIVGANAFLHESGIHQDVLGKLSGRNAFRSRIDELGYGDMSEEKINDAFERFKVLADSKKRITEDDLYALLSDQISAGTAPESQRFKLQSIQVVSGTAEMATATVKLIDTLAGDDGNKELIDAAIGRTGPIMAVFGAIQRLVQRKIRLLHYEVRAVSEGMDALGKVVVKVTEDVDSSGLDETTNLTTKTEMGGVVNPNKTYLGRGTDVDVVTASARAYVNAINRMFEGELISDKRRKMIYHFYIYRYYYIYPKARLILDILNSHDVTFFTHCITSYRACSTNY
ncbi:12826_t:CDS:2 [Entrophospora sp. SA101]|nr:12826_t:CDS:2 [Entrophospora sp. SA101]